MKLFTARKPNKSVVIQGDTIAVTTEGDTKSSFSFSLVDVLRVKAIRRDLITEDVIGLRFCVRDLDYDIYEEVEGFAELWRDVIDRYKPQPARVAEFQRLAGRTVEIELWAKPGD